MVRDAGKSPDPGDEIEILITSDKSYERADCRLSELAHSHRYGKAAL